MPTPSTLLLFSVAVFGLLLSPGPNMAFLLSHSLSHGARGGLAVATGIFLADLAMTGLTAAGVAAMVAAWAPSFDVLRYAGAIYLAWLAVHALRRQGATEMDESRGTAWWTVLRGAAINSLLNPKTLLFFLVFLPQFVEPGRGGVPLQLLGLGAWLSVIAFAFHALLGAFSGGISSFVSGNATVARWTGGLQATVLLGLAVRLLVLDRPALR
jgi:threonine/homoserine/homoserine lactone efflux protein